MNIKQQRVIIAQDVIDTLIAENSYNIEAGDYMEANGEGILIGNLFKYTGNSELQEQIKELSADCSVCAKGALMISAIDKFNTCSTADFLDSNQMIGTTHHLLNYFPKDMLDAIEAVFERCCYNWHGVEFFDSADHSPTEKGKELIDQSIMTLSRSATERLIEIMENIIENNGEFHFADQIFGK